MKRKRVAVLRGGPSDEYDISLLTGGSVLRALKTLDYDVHDVVITQKGEWLKDGYVFSPAGILECVDVVFIGLHGVYGEDGTVQRLLSRYGIPYTGSNALSSSIAMNKHTTKDHVKSLGVKLAPHTVVKKDSGPDYSRIATMIGESYGPEYVVKPVTGGSSVGTMMVDSIGKLTNALNDALSIYDSVIVEKRIRGREATCGVVDRFRNQKLYALPAVEIIPPSHTDFFARGVKYNGETKELCPSNFSPAVKEALEQYAKEIHRALGLSQYSRSDFMVADDGIYFLEVNTLPGLTEESLMPKALLAVGCSYEQFVDHLLLDAVGMSSRHG